jgi:general L-amino acid transport system permease protein
MPDVEFQTRNAVQAEIAPPKTSVGVIGWMKQNLFSSWVNALTTVVFGFLLYKIVVGTLMWAFKSAEWKVVSANFKLYFVGQYPQDQLWRVWICLALVSLLFGFSSGIWKGTIRQLSVVLAGILLVISFMPFITWNTTIWLGANIALLVAGYFLIRVIPKRKAITLIGWFISFPITLYLLNGFGGLQKVETNVWGGLLLALLIAIVAIVGSFPLGILLALGRTSKLPVIKWFCIGYIELIRGVPLITVLFMANFLVPLFLDFEVDNVLRVMIGATLFTAAYMAENVRGGLQSVPRGQYEAAKALGLNSSLSMTFIILPQALKAVIPAIVGQSISMFKDTSLVAIVGLFDLLGIAKSIVANPDFLGLQMEAFLFIALIYWCISYSMSYASRRLEKNLGVGER